MKNEDYLNPLHKTQEIETASNSLKRDALVNSCVIVKVTVQGSGFLNEE
jgi:hypothetical protein